MRPISMVAKPMKLTISPTVASPLRVEPGAEHEDRDHRDGRGGARQHRQQRPPVQHRELRRQRLADDAVHLAASRRPAARSSGSGGCCPARRRRGRPARCAGPRPASAAGRSCSPPRRWRSAKNRISTISSRPSRQFMNRLSGSMMNSATKVARFSRKNDSQMPNRLSTPVSMTLISRPECCALWKENGSNSTCSK